MAQKIQSYEILNILGHGGMGVVYKARHEFRNEIVAVKSLSHQYALDPELRKRFQNEASILSKLDHLNIVKILDFIEDVDSLHIVMEYVEGRTLDTIIGQEVGPIPYQKALPLFEQILDGMSYAHSRGIIHRDLKPSNIIVTKDNKVKITDFGIARLKGQSGMTKTGTKMGTLYYMSPEQIRGEHVDEQSDIYSLGITLYEMLAGRLPFERKSDASEFMIMNQIVNDEIKDPREYYPFIPNELVTVIYQAVSKDKQKRISSVFNFSTEITKATEETKLHELNEKNIAQENIKPIKIENVLSQKEPDISPNIDIRSIKKKQSKKKMLWLASLGILVIIVTVILLLTKTIELNGTTTKTIEFGTALDQEGKSFKTIKIGDQEWMTENLNVDSYQNGDLIPEAKNEKQWASITTGAWCYYNNDPENGKKYGKLYNWYAVNDARGLPPKGWHIPTQDEFKTLKAKVNDDGNAMKEVGQGTGSGLGTNTSGFSALLAGSRYFYFLNLGFGTYFWSSTESNASYAYGVYLFYYDSSISFNGSNKQDGFSVRCLKDN